MMCISEAQIARRIKEEKRINILSLTHSIIPRCCCPQRTKNEYSMRGLPYTLENEWPRDFLIFKYERFFLSFLRLARSKNFLVRNETLEVFLPSLRGNFHGGGWPKEKEP